ncbi:MAG TPA: UDP-N-acetylmuramoyl-tripeptide--D-alanyl-D-alanine ligase, partial [Burkholderiales bacterium]|nr:UDP-N-acetylmuramoyl-tripeptide--D-alanyl-D-alanine ligase [Burkholderiales bacterium]
FGSEIELHAPQGATRIELHADGRHNVLNACAAAACALATGADLEAVARGLAVFRPVGGRMQRRTTLSGAKLIDDSYNANPDSVRAAIEVLAAEPGEKFLLLGDMAEVGERGVEFHEEIGRYARERGIDRLYAAGALSRACIAAFGKGARHFATVEALITAAQGELRPQTTMLVKGSRFMRMERVVEALAGEPSSAGRH